MKYLVLSLKGEKWVAYPKGMRFPRQFADCYPFRGRGIVAKLLYILNWLGLDRMLLKTEGFAGADDVALFWPSSVRSTGRHYGYRVQDGQIIEYLKFATSDDEKAALKREAKNVAIAQRLSDGRFQVPRCLGVDEQEGNVVAHFEPLPMGAVTPPVNDRWYGMVDAARKQIAAFGYYHGDFAWHNFKSVGDQLWILDWEELRKDGNALVDEISLDFGLDYYWRKHSEEQVLRDFRERYQGAKWDEAFAAVRSLRDRKITMGDVLGREFL